MEVALAGVLKYIACVEGEHSEIPHLLSCPTSIFVANALTLDTPHNGMSVSPEPRSSTVHTFGAMGDGP